MPKRFVLRTAIIFSAMLFATGCSAKAPYPSVSLVAEEWLAVKQTVCNQTWGSADLTASIPPEKLQAGINEFHLTLNRFLVSPVGSLYRTRRPAEMESISGIVAELDRLKNAVQDSADIEREAIPIIIEIDTQIELLQRVDAKLSNTSQLHYFQLFFFFSLLVIIIILGMRILHSRLEKAESRERQSLIFSRETMTAQEQERSRIARELHDTVAQDLWRLSFQTDTIGKTADTEERSRLCAEAVSGQKELMRRVRSICENLVPPDFQRRHLGDVLKNLCYNFEQRTGIECRLTVQSDEAGSSEALNGDVQLQYFRIVQECLANIEKHSGATEVSAFIRRKDNELLICVSDNGKGFAAPDPPAMNADAFSRLREEGHFGLWNMYERASLLGGTLDLDSEAGEGTTITLRVPLQTTGEKQ